MAKLLQAFKAQSQGAISTDKQVQSILNLVSKTGTYRLITIVNGQPEMSHIHSIAEAKEQAELHGLQQNSFTAGDQEIWSAYNPEFILTADVVEPGSGVTLKMYNGEIMSTTMPYREIVALAGLEPGFRYGSGHERVEDLAINPRLLARYEAVGTSDILKNPSQKPAVQVWFIGQREGQGLLLALSLAEFEAKMAKHGANNPIDFTQSAP